MTQQLVKSSECELLEVQDRIRKISTLRECLDTLRTIVQEKMEMADPSVLERAQGAVNTLFSSMDFWKGKRKRRKNLFSVSWDLYPKFVKAYALLHNFRMGDDDHFVRYGYQQGTIEEKLNLDIIKAFKAAKKIPLLTEDHDPQYYSPQVKIDSQEALNKDHNFLMLEDLQKETLKPIILSLKQQIANCIGSKWRVITIRSWETDSNANEFGPNAWHTDGLPVGVYKIMYYPFAVDYEHGTVELQLAGKTHALKGPPGTWMLFKNSEVVHRGVRPKVGIRLAIEITLTHALEYNLEPIDAGLNAQYPLLPWQQPSVNSSHQKEDFIGVNIGGGHKWACNGWRNLEEVASVSNPTPFHLYPNCRFPFANESIKHVYTAHAIEQLNLATVYRVLSESYRILETDGNLIIKIPDYDKALDCWRKGDFGFFEHSWNIESVIHTWQTRGLSDCLDYRAAMVFCSFFNDAYGNPFHAKAKTRGVLRSLFSLAKRYKSNNAYYGPPVVEVDFLRDLIKDGSPSQIAQALRLAVAKKESNYHFSHQSAWSRAELAVMLSEFGFDVVSFDPNVIISTFNAVTGISELQNISTYCWAKKRP